jgi:hypothetical protein
MNKEVSLHTKLAKFIDSEGVFRYWMGGSGLAYTEAVNCLVNKGNYWLIDEIASVIFPRLPKKNRGEFYLIELFINDADQSEVMSVSDGDGNIYLNYRIKWIGFPLLEKESIKFYLCNLGGCYCLMLPSED